MVVLHQSGEIDSDGEGENVKHLWKKASAEYFADGGKRIKYKCEDFPGVSIYSNTEYMPHTWDNGGWLYHSYYVQTLWRFRKDFRTLKEAKAFVENGGLGHVNKEVTE